jgi:Putative glycolipid-binding
VIADVLGRRALDRALLERQPLLRRRRLFAFDGTELQPWPEPQRYACLEKESGGALYRFESLDGGFTADLPVDSDDLVLDCPGLFRRIIP